MVVVRLTVEAGPAMVAVKISCAGEQSLNVAEQCGQITAGRKYKPWTDEDKAFALEAVASYRGLSTRQRGT